jgi:uncharacterized protein (DUF983 family)
VKNAFLLAFAGVAGTAVMVLFGALYAALIMVGFSLWHSVQPQIPAFGYLQIWFPMITIEAILTFLVTRVRGSEE